MAKSDNYDFSRKWLLKRKHMYKNNKNKVEQSKPKKYNSIDNRLNKKKLRTFPGNFEIYSIIGKRNDRKALLTMIDIYTGDFYMRKYNRTAAGFASRVVLKILCKFLCYIIRKEVFIMKKRKNKDLEMVFMILCKNITYY